MVEGPASKRARCEPDLKVVFDDGETMVHSLILVLASPVFEKMLTSSLREGQGDEIKLPGKAKTEFMTVYNSLQLSTSEPLTQQSAVFLSRWADEYQIASLMTKCEEYLMSSVVADVAGLEHAVKYGMRKRVSQCIDVLKQNLENNLDALSRLAVAAMEEQLRSLWPDLCQKAGLGAFPMPAPDQVRAMWPFLAAAMRTRPGSVKFERLQREAKRWPMDLYVHLPGAGNACTKGQDWLKDKLVKTQVL
uniref:BTB domain-containing protein n=1 Tax=Zooxanthella nutricula TaxID=1333877 RepID=A0A7S2QKP3_9DINO